MWPEAVDFGLVETVIWENEIVESYELPAEPDVGCPTLLLTGGRGPGHLRAVVRALDNRLPASHLVELEGVGHVGTRSAPTRVADAVRSFCVRSPSRR